MVVSLLGAAVRCRQPRVTAVHWNDYASASIGCCCSKPWLGTSNSVWGPGGRVITFCGVIRRGFASHTCRKRLLPSDIVHWLPRPPLFFSSRAAQKNLVTVHQCASNNICAQGNSRLKHYPAQLRVKSGRDFKPNSRCSFRACEAVQASVPVLPPSSLDFGSPSINLQSTSISNHHRAGGCLTFPCASEKLRHFSN